MELSMISKITNYLLKISVGLGVLIFIFIDKIIPYVYFLQGNSIVFHTWFLRICNIFGILTIWELIKIFDTISKNSPFVANNEISLKKIAIYSMIFALLFFIKTFFYPTYLSIIIIFIFLFVGICAYIFSQLFKESLIYKTENDLTI